MVREEGALRFVSMDEEEEKRLKIIRAILHQILSLQQLPLRHHRRLLPASLLIKVPLLPPMTICLSNSYFPSPSKIFSSCSTLPATLTAADHLTGKGFGRTDSSSSATLTLFWHMSKLSPRGNQSSTFSLPLDAISEEKGYFWCKDSNSCRRVGIETRQTCTRYNTHHSSSAIRSHPIRQLVSEIQKAKKVIFKVQR